MHNGDMDQTTLSVPQDSRWCMVVQHLSWCILFQDSYFLPQNSTTVTKPFRLEFTSINNLLVYIKTVLSFHGPIKCQAIQ